MRSFYIKTTKQSIDSNKSFQKLYELCQAGLIERYQNPSYDARKRLEYELSAIKKLGFEDAFLVAHDLVTYAIENEVFIAPGRGSATGSIVCYCLKITNIEPMQHGLLFERFLNPDYIVTPFPEIPIFCSQPSKIEQYAFRKYSDHILLKEDIIESNSNISIGIYSDSCVKIIDKTLKCVKKNQNVDININSLDMSEKKVYRTICEDKIISLGFINKNILSSIDPSTFEELIAAIRLSGFEEELVGDLIQQYTTNKLSKTHQSQYSVLQDLLSETFECLLYQEQIMQILHQLYGYSLYHAGYFLNALMHQKTNVLEKEQKNIDDCIYDLISNTQNVFVGNKAHFTALSTMIYQYIWLYCYFPEEFNMAYNNINSDNQIVEI